jgi:hypothetical protein
VTAPWPVAASGRLAAYDAETGEPRWFGPRGGGGYSSPHLLTIDGVAQVVLLTGARSTSVALADGALLWEHSSGEPTDSILQPALAPDRGILIATSDFAGNGIRRIAVAHGPGGWAVEERWTSRGLKPYFNDFVVHEGHAYGFDGSILACIDLAGGQRKWKGGHDKARGEVAHAWAQFLPDGRRFLFQVASAKEENGGLFVTSLDAPSERRRIRAEDTRFQLVAPGFLLFVQGGKLLAQRFDTEKLVATREPVAIASSVASFSQAPSWGWFSASATGRLAWLSSQGDEVRLEWVDRAGGQVGSLGDPGKYGQIVLSPDGRRVVAEIADPNGRYDLWTIDAARGVRSRLTSDPANERDPVWSPDGREIIFSSDARGDQDLVRKGLEGLEPPAPLPGGIGQKVGERDIAKEWVREGNTRLYLTLGAERVLWSVPLDGHEPPEALVKGFEVDQPRVSPDGRWLATISTESGRFEVYVQPFRRRGERLRVSSNGGGQPRWRGDGKELFYLGLDGTPMAVAVRSGAAGLELGMPETLVSARNLGAVLEGSDYADYAATVDGQRFLVKRRVGGSERPRVHVLLDWPSLLG